MSTLELNTHLGVKGFFNFVEAFKGTRVVTVDPLRSDLDDWEPPEGEGRILSVLEFPGTRRRLYGDGVGGGSRPNLLLDAGVDGMAEQNNWMAYNQVGQGVTAPAYGQTALVDHVNGTNTLASSDNTGAQGTQPYYLYLQRTYRHAVGDAAGNLNELAVGWGASGATIICRHKTINSQGDEQTISVQSDEWLDVQYEMRYYPPLDDVNGTITLNSLTYDTITRASDCTSATLATRIGTTMGQYSAVNSDWRAYDGTIGAITTTPSGNTADCDNANQSNESYVPDSAQVVMVCNTGAGGWNLGAGIRSIRISSTAGNFQTRFGRQGGGDETIPKTTGFTMQLKWTLSWSEILGILPPVSSFGITGHDADLTLNP